MKLAMALIHRGTARSLTNDARSAEIGSETGHDRSEELGQIEYQGEQVYGTMTHNVLPSWMIIDQLTPLAT
jgi:hypothetical protein